MKKILSYLLIISFIICLTACGQNSTAQISENIQNESVSSQNLKNQKVNTILETNSMFTSRDKEIGYDESSATKLVLENETMTISKEGIYILSGEISNGGIVVDVGDIKKVQLVLNGVSINSSNTAPIYIKSANKIFITLATGSKNSLSVIGEYTENTENNVDGAIFSKSDITFNGNGELTVNADYGHGIVGKDDIVFTGGTYQIEAEKHGISANDSVRVSDGIFSIKSGKDGIQVENIDDSEKGFFYMANGSLTVSAEGDAISASGVIQIDDGKLNLTTGNGAESVTLKSDSMGGGMRQNMQQQPTITEENSVSQKGLKGDNLITINGGIFMVDTIDDGIHSAKNLQIVDGNFTIKSGDDAIHSDEAVIIENGIFEIPFCYEGIEGLSITINNGTFNIVSSDDGLNSAGGTDSSGFGGRGNPFETTEGAFIIINGGDITIVSDGDSIDSNGTLTVNSGTLKLTCNGNGNTAIDTNGTFTNNGGNISTNDGSESGNNIGGNGGKRPNKGNRPQDKKDIPSPADDRNPPNTLPQN